MVDRTLAPMVGSMRPYFSSPDAGQHRLKPLKVRNFARLGITEVCPAALVCDHRVAMASSFSRACVLTSAVLVTGISLHYTLKFN